MADIAVVNNQINAGTTLYAFGGLNQIVNTASYKYDSGSNT